MFFQYNPQRRRPGRHALGPRHLAPTWCTGAVSPSRSPPRPAAPTRMAASPAAPSSQWQADHPLHRGENVAADQATLRDGTHQSPRNPVPRRLPKTMRSSHWRKLPQPGHRRSARRNRRSPASAIPSPGEEKKTVVHGRRLRPARRRRQGPALQVRRPPPVGIPPRLSRDGKSTGSAAAIPSIPARCGSAPTSSRSAANTSSSTPPKARPSGRSAP